jgi:hypothetical protein
MDAGRNIRMAVNIARKLLQVIPGLKDETFS